LLDQPFCCPETQYMPAMSLKLIVDNCSSPQRQVLLWRFRQDGEIMRRMQASETHLGLTTEESVVENSRPRYTGFASPPAPYPPVGGDTPPPAPTLPPITIPLHPWTHGATRSPTTGPDLPPSPSPTFHNGATHSPTTGPNLPPGPSPTFHDGATRSPTTGPIA